MFDFAWSEFALIGIVGLLFIGPKDMPVAIRTVTNLLKKGRKLAGEFQTHVDEMVREADLGEARDQLRQLRSFNVRGQIMKALDEDGSLRRMSATGVLAPDPTLPAAPSSLPPAMPPPADAPVMRPLTEDAGTTRWQPSFSGPATEEDPALVAADPAPPIVPPAVARRLRVERARALPPRFVPPRPSHPTGRR